MRSLIIALIVIIAALQYKLWFAAGSVPEVLVLKQSLQRQMDKNDQLKMRNKALEAEVKNLKIGQKALEERARTDLGMVREGETFYQIIEAPRRRTN